MMGQYKRITKEYDGTWTGKGTTNGGLNGRTEATGFGIVFFAREVLKHFGDPLKERLQLFPDSVTYLGEQSLS